MIKLFFLILSITLFQNTTGGIVPENFGKTDLTRIIKTVIAQSKNGEIELTNGCLEQLGWYFENLQTFDDGMWALKMIDASGKLSAGLFTFNFGWIGDYDECLSIEATEKDVKGNYCLAALNGSTESETKLIRVQAAYKEYKNKKLSSNDSAETQSSISPCIALCIPHKCNKNDVKIMLRSLLSTLEFAVTCQTKDDINPPLDTGAILTISYFGVFIIIMALSTIYDVFHDKNKEPGPLLIAFSVYTNSRRLFKIKKNAGKVSCLHGMRFLSMMWVIIGHVFLSVLSEATFNIADYVEYIGTTRSLIFVNGVHSVDTFLVVTGFLVVYTFMKATHQGYKFNIIIFYLHRYLRLTPPLIPVILSSIFLLKYLGSGPFYPQLMLQFTDPCKQYWWSTVLYIQNYIDEPEMCVPQSWYLNVDWQLYLISPIFLLFLPKRPFIGLSLMLCATIGSMMSCFIITWKNKLPALQNNVNGNLLDYAELYYKNTHTRASTWFIGAFMGYIIAKIKFQSNSRCLQLPKWLVTFIWCVALTTIPVCIFAGFDTLTSDEYHPYANAFYNTFTRPAWGLCIAWIIFACMFGYGGIINAFLSHPIFQILNRFTYSIFLLHYTVLFTIVLAQKHPVYYSLFNIAYSFWGIFALSLALSIFWVLSFESPIPVLEKCLLTSLQTYSKKNKQINSGTSNESNIGLPSNSADTIQTEP